jgi:hypothetical protein
VKLKEERVEVWKEGGWKEKQKKKARNAGCEF